MNSRFAIALCCVGAIAYACGPRVAAEPSAAPVPAESARDGAPLASSLRVTVDEAVQLTLHVTNNSDRHIELRFPSGQTHDFVVLDSAGREVWRYSEGRMFTQALQTRLVSRGETVTYDERLDAPLPSGTYMAVARLTSTTHPLETRVEFDLP